jgi:hypothetical protein
MWEVGGCSTCCEGMARRWSLCRPRLSDMRHVRPTLWQLNLRLAVTMTAFSLALVLVQIVTRAPESLVQYLATNQCRIAVVGSESTANPSGEHGHERRGGMNECLELSSFQLAVRSWERVWSDAVDTLISALLFSTNVIIRVRSTSFSDHRTNKFSRSYTA